MRNSGSSSESHRNGTARKLFLGQRCESTKTPSKDLAKKILKKREAEIALGRFQVGWAGERMTFAELCEEFFRSHSSTLSPKSQANHKMFLKNLRGYWGDRKLTEIDERAVVEYRNYRRCQPLKRDPKQMVKGATVNDSCAQETSRFDPQGTESGHQPINHEEVRGPQLGTMDNQKLMLHENGFGDHRR